MEEVELGGAGVVEVVGATAVEDGDGEEAVVAASIGSGVARTDDRAKGVTVSHWRTSR